MLIRRPDDNASSEITPVGLYQKRRAFLGAAGALALLSNPRRTHL